MIEYMMSRLSGREEKMPNTNGYLIKNRLAEPVIENKNLDPYVLETLFLKVVGHVKKGLVVSEFAPKWEGHYVIKEAYNIGILNFLSLD